MMKRKALGPVGVGSLDNSAAAPVAAEATMQSAAPGLRQLWRNMVWPFLLACGFLIFVSASSIYLVISSQSSREMMNRALTFENKMLGMLGALRVAESEQRGYLLTGDPRYLRISVATADAGLEAIAAVREVLPDNPAQQLAFT
jgi:CHASE3 domain sensor protein